MTEPKSKNRDNRRWDSKCGEWFFSAEINGIKLELSRHKGTRESYGGKSLLARHFLEKVKWQNHVKENFGEEIFEEIFNTMKQNYDDYKKNN